MSIFILIVLAIPKVKCTELSATQQRRWSISISPFLWIPRKAPLWRYKIHNALRIMILVCVCVYVCVSVCLCICVCECVCGDCTWSLHALELRSDYVLSFVMRLCMTCLSRQAHDRLHNVLQFAIMLQIVPPSSLLIKTITSLYGTDSWPHSTCTLLFPSLVLSLSLLSGYNGIHGRALGSGWRFRRIPRLISRTEQSRAKRNKAEQSRAAME